MPNYQVRADVFPATITITDPENPDIQTVHDKVRVILTLDHVYVFQDNGSKTPPIIFEDRLTSYTPPLPSTRVRSAKQLLNRSATFETEDGYTASFVRASGCGCGSRLKTASLTTLLPSAPSNQAASTHDSL